MALGTGKTAHGGSLTGIIGASRTTVCLSARQFKATELAIQARPNFSDFGSGTIASTSLCPCQSWHLLEGFTIPLRVCDRAAQAITHTAKEIKFDSDWALADRDAAIVKLKKYCEESTS